MLESTTLFFLFVACAIATLALGWKNLHKRGKNTYKVVEKPTTRSDKWQYPEPSPDLTFDMKQTPPPSFRAFSTIEIKKLDKDSWILLDNEFPRYHRAKVARLADRGDKVVSTLPHAREAVRELCQDLSEFLSRRYPQVYNLTRSTTDQDGWYGEGSITKIEIPSLGASYDLTKEDPLTVAGLIQPCDLNILVKQEDGQYQLSAMMIAIGGGQRLKDKLGKCLDGLHLGRVPHYTEQLQNPLNRFLAKLKVEGPIARNTTAISIHDELHWPTITMGPEDDWDLAIGGPGIGTPSYGKFKPPAPINNISQLFFRQERQTLRRLPKSGALVWAVHTYILPLASILDEPGIPGRLASLIRSWDDETAE
ncbi:MAG: hypothetical protein M1834_009463 [Cirrosporium novae-zelandiae]|nr:MAG: hypothetical protein M1834_009463 [Cirrosporium novae-zelandiae]